MQPVFSLDLCSSCLCGSQNSWKYDGRCICQCSPFFLQDVDALLLLLENAFIMPTCEASNGNLFLLLSESISKLAHLMQLERR